MSISNQCDTGYRDRCRDKDCECSCHAKIKTLKVGDLVLVQGAWYVVDDLNLADGEVRIAGQGGSLSWVHWVDIETAEVSCGRGF